MNSSNVKKVQEFLVTHPGYVKWGCGKISDKLGCTYEEVKEAKKSIYIDKVSIKKNTWNEKKFYEELEKSEIVVEEKSEIKLPKILVLDIETAPIRAYVWRLWKQDIYIDQIISEWFMLSWSAKFLGEKEVMSDRLYSEEVADEMDFRIVKKLWNLLNEADIVIAHNGNSFDLPKIRARFAINGLPPTSFYQQIDTKVIAAKEFGFSSNKLDALAQNFGLGKKIHTEFDLWARCMKGEDAALEEMEIYNRHDVELLEEIYLKLRPYIKNHPNVTLYDDNVSAERCTSCGSIHLTKDGHYFTSTGKFPVFRCEDCGSLTRGRKAIKRGVVTSNLSLGK